MFSFPQPLCRILQPAALNIIISNTRATPCCSAAIFAVTQSMQGGGSSKMAIVVALTCHWTSKEALKISWRFKSLIVPTSINHKTHTLGAFQNLLLQWNSMAFTRACWSLRACYHSHSLYIDQRQGLQLYCYFQNTPLPCVFHHLD